MLSNELKKTISEIETVTISFSRFKLLERAIRETELLAERMQDAELKECEAREEITRLKLENATLKSKLDHARETTQRIHDNFIKRGLQSHAQGVLNFINQCFNY